MAQNILIITRPRTSGLVAGFSAFKLGFYPVYWWVLEGDLCNRNRFKGAGNDDFNLPGERDFCLNFLGNRLR